MDQSDLRIVAPVFPRRSTGATGRRALVPPAAERGAGMQALYPLAIKAAAEAQNRPAFVDERR